MASRRQKRVEDLLRDEIVQIIRREFTDGDSPYLTFTGVEVSKDFSNARVFVSFLQKSKEKAWMKKLTKAEGFIRSKLDKVVRLRRIPRLFFKVDDSIARAFELEETLAQITSNEENSQDNS